ncbi:NAD-dependent epimerase/dehydratase [Methylophaga lonarensis MPL]|uniref:NAD-dependent epimerase/dehydratase n=1 Tax=Methylophaga lonarensis MPL TaxID=1286106 RepID=M7PUF5_9GAMM|nr:NAD-dependent epimerase/dehydratase [Methylophaga lonarensis MPL]
MQTNDTTALKNKRILVTGSAGFIGFHLTKALLSEGANVIGIDNLNDYYEPALKQARLDELDKFHASISAPAKSRDSDDASDAATQNSETVVNKNSAVSAPTSDLSAPTSVIPVPTSVIPAQAGIQSVSKTSPEYQFIKMDLADRAAIESLFKTHHFDIVVNLAAQAGVRYSLENPHAYVDSNLIGFVNILEGCRHAKVGHLVYASSSSVYGMNIKQPFSTEDRVDYPISLYAATKKANELMAHTYSHLYGIPTTGLRFFTVYGPWGRPDMAYYKFTKAILEDKPIDIYNHGQMKRDFTYIDDIVDGILRVMVKPPQLESDTSSTTTATSAPNIVIPAPTPDTLAPNSVIPAPNSVIPAQAGIHDDKNNRHCEERSDAAIQSNQENRHCEERSDVAIQSNHSGNKITNAQAPYKIYNIGNNQPVTLRHFITAIENACGKKAIENSLPMQAGDVPITYADIDDLMADTGFKPTTSIDSGIARFAEWYKLFYTDNQSQNKTSLNSDITE